MLALYAAYVAQIATGKEPSDVCGLLVPTCTPLSRIDIIPGRRREMNAMHGHEELAVLNIRVDVVDNEPKSQQCLGWSAEAPAHESQAAR